MQLWLELDAESQGEFFDLVYDEPGPPMLIGGPFDGLEYESEGAGCVYVDADAERVAVYEMANSRSAELVFTGMKRKGEGCHPDIYPQRQQS